MLPQTLQGSTHTSLEGKEHIMHIDIPTPNVSVKIDDYHGGKFAAVIALVITATFAGYQGWVLVPDVDTLGGVFQLGFALAALAVVLYAVRKNTPSWTLVALIVAFIGGMVAIDVWKGLGEFFTSLSWAEGGGLLLGLVVTVLVAAWCAKR